MSTNWEMYKEALTAFIEGVGRSVLIPLPGGGVVWAEKRGTAVLLRIRPKSYTIALGTGEEGSSPETTA